MNWKWALACLLLAGCRVGPEYEPPVTPIVEAWKNEEEPASAPAVSIEQWWNVFQDDTLSCLEEEAVANNPTLDLAYARIQEAWAQAGVSYADLGPKVNFNPSYSNMMSLFQFFLPPGVNIPGLTTVKPFRVHQFQYVFPFNLSYELDLWQRHQREYESSVLNAESEEFAYKAALLSLTTDLASAYFNLRAQDLVNQILKEDLELLQKRYALNKSRFDKGLVTYLDVAEAAVEVDTAETNYQEGLRARGLLENLIGALIGEPAALFCIASAPFPLDPPSVPAGLPSTVLLQRPDIAEAERTRASQHALVGAAYAAFFPTFQLTGTLGFLSPTYDDFMKWNSRLWQYGANSDQTVFDGGLKYSNYQAAWARFDEADAEYKQTVLTAFREVEDALNNLRYQAKEQTSILKAVQDSGTAYNMSSKRYDQGLINFFEVIQNHRPFLTSRINLVTLAGNRYQSTIQLIKALGGAWNVSLPCESSSFIANGF